MSTVDFEVADGLRRWILTGVVNQPGGVAFYATSLASAQLAASCRMSRNHYLTLVGHAFDSAAKVIQDEEEKKRRERMR